MQTVEEDVSELFADIVEDKELGPLSKNLSQAMQNVWKSCNNVPKDSKLLFGYDINQRIMSISKTSKSVVKYQSSSRYGDKYSRPSKI